MKNPFKEAQQERRTVNDVRLRRVGEPWNHFCVQDAVKQRGNSKEKTYDWSRCADIEKHTIGTHRRANQDKRSKGAREVGEREKERHARAQMMVAASKKVAQLMGEQNRKQSSRKWQAREKTRGIPIEKREGVDKLVKRHSLIVRVSDGKLRARDKATAKRKEKKRSRENQRLHRRPRRNLRVMPLVRKVVAPIDGNRYRRRRTLWQWWSHEVVSVAIVCSLE